MNPTTPVPDLAGLASDISGFDPDDLAQQASLHEKVAAAVRNCVGVEDAAPAEALLQCLLASLAAAGEHGKALLDQMLLDLLPLLASLAPRSDTCCQQLVALCSLAVAACSPRDCITAFLEALDSLLADSPDCSASTVQLMCSIMALLPQLLTQLPRRKAAFATECCVAVAALAKAHGKVLTGWALSQLTLAARQQVQQQEQEQQQQQQQHQGPPAAGTSPAADALRRLDTFLAASWQPYIEFAGDVLHKVLPQDADAAARDKAQVTVALLVLQLLQHLTSAWPPPGLQQLVLQVMAPVAADQHMPGVESVSAPAPMLAATHIQRHAQAQAAAATGAAGAASTSATMATTATRHVWDSNASGAVLELLQLLPACGCGSWQQLADVQGDAAPGAGLAALYGSTLHTQAQAKALLEQPDKPVAAVQMAAAWSCAMSETSDFSPPAIVKAMALLQLPSAHAHALQQEGATRQRPCSSGEPAAAPTTSPAAAADEPVPDAVPGLLPHLCVCVSLLAGITCHAPSQALRSQAYLSLQQLLQGLPGPDRFACLQALLLGCPGSSPAPHPEVAALLMQGVRLQLANDTTGSGCFGPDSCMQLAVPWLQQHGNVGWHDADTLPDRANAICAALAVVRLALLRRQAGSAAAAAGSAAAAAGSAAAAQQQVRPVLAALSAAVSTALGQLQAANSAEVQQQEEGLTQAGGAGGSSGGSGSDARLRLPGEASGAGQAIDAWLAVSRVQDVLDRVQELLGP